jgi:hypothetical protein
LSRLREGDLPGQSDMHVPFVQVTSGNPLESFIVLSYKKKMQPKGQRMERSIGSLFLLVVVVAAFGSFAVGRYDQSVRRARGAAYKQELDIIRQAIKLYTLDEHQPPKSLQDLVKAHYLPAVPNLPFNQVWDVAPVLGDPVLSPNLATYTLIDENQYSEQVGGNSDKDHPADQLAGLTGR